ncbi:AAA family ATPase [Algoriphagus sp. AGSA1]|uniref:AAA family ATPase n=1 Tax=Algoriphagus sp. AGSA1 TaxID=2907213 RepID=UPI001F364397|nr:AAA family ATPase [Algoriphagus sp. AGSA1]MCE7054242.1 AAA family ATPase [Algoriphagus sp. AGSA1]
MENKWGSNSLLVIVMGLPGSGKSYFAARLANEIGATHLQSDKIRVHMGLKGKYSEADKNSVYKELCDQTKTLLENHKSVVVDATFHLDFYRRLFYAMADKINVPVITLLIEADEETVRERLKKQRKLSEADYNTYLRLKEDFDPVLHPFLHLYSTDSNVDSMLNQTVNYLTIGNDR